MDIGSVVEQKRPKHNAFISVSRNLSLPAVVAASVVATSTVKAAEDSMNPIWVRPDNDSSRLLVLRRIETTIHVLQANLVHYLYCSAVMDSVPD